MSDRVFCIGNGENRLSFPIEKLKGKGKIYGCNAIYRDNPDVIDVLTSVDYGICHEIYHSGYAQKVPCYFRGWSKVPAYMYETMALGFADKAELDIVKHFDGIITNEKETSTEFVMHGSTIKGIVGIIKGKRDIAHHNPEVVKKHIKKSHLYVSWIKDGDKSHDFKDVDINFQDHGWASGATSGFIACRVEKPKEVYLIGHDLESDSDKINNVYKGTPNYTTKSGAPTPSVNWIDQWRMLMGWCPDITFYKVNKDESEVPTCRELPEWSKLLNIKYMTHKQLLDKLDIT